MTFWCGAFGCFPTPIDRIPITREITSTLACTLEKALVNTTQTLACLRVQLGRSHASAHASADDCYADHATTNEKPNIRPRFFAAVCAPRPVKAVGPPARRSPTMFARHSPTAAPRGSSLALSRRTAVPTTRRWARRPARAQRPPSPALAPDRTASPSPSRSAFGGEIAYLLNG